VEPTGASTGASTGVSTGAYTGASTGVSAGDEVVTTGVSITAAGPAVGSGVVGKPLETSAIGCTETVDAGNRIAIHLTRN
jgi:hypothetical protein